MYNTLALGSCRVRGAMYKKALLTKIGRLYSSSDFIQAFSILNGDLNIPKENVKYFSTCADEFKTIDIDNIENIVIEISSSRYYKDDKFVYAIGPKREIPNSKICFETHEDIVGNLDLLRDKWFKNRKIVIIGPNILVTQPNRYELAFILSSWCKRNNYPYLDLAYIYAKNGLLSSIHQTKFKDSKTDRIDHISKKASDCLYETILACFSNNKYYLLQLDGKDIC